MEPKGASNFGQPTSTQMTESAYCTWHRYVSLRELLKIFSPILHWPSPATWMPMGDPGVFLGVLLPTAAVLITKSPPADEQV